MARTPLNIITIANIKGGVGKTSTTVNFAFLLSQNFSKRVLVVDADDQGNATKTLGARDNFEHDKESLWAGLVGKQNYASVIVETPHPNLWVIPATKDLRQAQTTFGTSARGMKLIQRLLEGAEKDFDFVLIDTKPQVNILLQAALSASHWYLIPSFPETDSYDGFIDLIAEAEEIREEINPKLNCLGILFSCYKKCPAHDSYLSFVRPHLKKAGIPLVPTLIRASNAMATGTLHQRPALSLQTARTLKDDYTAALQWMMSSMKKPRSQLKRPNLKLLGLQSMKSKAEAAISPNFDLTSNEDAFDSV